MPAQQQRMFSKNPGDVHKHRNALCWTYSRQGNAKLSLIVVSHVVGLACNFGDLDVRLRQACQTHLGFAACPKACTFRSQHNP